MTPHDDGISPNEMIQLPYRDLQNIALTVSNATKRAFGPPSHHQFTVPNNIIGRAVMWILKRYLNRQVYKITLRGRKPKVKGARRYNRYGLKKADSKILAVYVQMKHPYDKE